MLKKLSVLAVVLLVLAQASAVFAADIPANKFAPALDGVISENEYPANSAYTLDKKTVDSYNGCWAGTMTDDMKVTYYLAWDDSGLYCAADIKDSTSVPAQSWDCHGGDGGPSADAFQLCLFSGEGGISRWLTVGAYPDGKLSARTHYGDISDLADYVKGTCVYNDGGMVIECLIPWDIIDADAPVEGLSIPVLFTYMDRFDGGEVCYKTVDANAWPPSAAIDNNIVLGGTYTAPAPETAAPETEAPAAEAPVVTPAAQTSDAGIVVGIVMLAAAAVVLSKKSK